MDELENPLNLIKKYLDDLAEYHESLRLAELFMSKKSMAAPLTYKEIFDILFEKKVITESLARRMKLPVTKRNLPAHEYGQITRSDVLDLIKTSA